MVPAAGMLQSDRKKETITDMQKGTSQMQLNLGTGCDPGKAQKAQGTIGVQEGQGQKGCIFTPLPGRR